MRIVTYKIDNYVLREGSAALKSEMAVEAIKVIDLYSGKDHVASAYFAEENFCKPYAIFSEERIHFHAPAHQYEAVTKRLSTGKCVYIAWTPFSDTTESKYGEAYFLNEVESVFETNPSLLRL